MKFARIASAVATLLILLASLPAAAEVSLKNGNFFTGSKDIIFSGGFELKIERVYNSKTAFKGIFGNGWGNEYEVYLDVGGDGAVTVHEYGGGAENRFDSPAMTPDEIAKSVDQIVTVAKARTDVTGEQNLKTYSQKLVSDAMFREGEWRKYIKLGLLQQRLLPVGTRLISGRFSYQSITVQRDGYRRDFDNGRIEFYRKDGRLRQVSDKNGNYITFSYDIPGQVTIHDDLNRSLMLSLNEKGLVTRVEGSNGGVCTYRYNEQDELVYANDSDHKTYEYEYDAGKRHNLTKMSYPDGTKMLVTYYPWEQFENVKSVTDRDGTLTEYTYDVDPKDPHHYTVAVKASTGPDKTGKRKPISSSSYEYINTTKPDGEEFTARLVTIIDGDRTDTTYNLDGLPTRIERNGRIVTFAYDSHGHVLEKVEPEVSTELTYDPITSKVSSVRKSDTPTGKVAYQGNFSYDSKGNLLTASSEGISVTLIYDTKGRIAELDSNDGKKIAFEYNANSKPVKISVLEHKDETGKTIPTASINVTYTNSGDIKKVDSDSGRATALAVTSAFQRLLDLIRPAGVELSF
jgi:YD repeat-containing protein